MNELQQVEREIEQYKADMAIAEKLEKLHSNREFKEIILNGFLRENVIRLVGLKGHPDMQTAEKQASVLKQIDAVSVLTDYFRQIFNKGEIADRNIADHERLHSELLKEEAQNHG